MSETPKPTIGIDDIPVERRREWVRVITSAYTVLMRDVPSGDRLKMQIRAFDDVCSDIPTPLLYDAYKLSCLATDDRGNLAFWDARLLLKTYLESPDLRDKYRGLLVAASTSTIADCKRCFGLLTEIVPGLGARPCDHLPIEEEKETNTDAENNNRMD